MTVQRLDTIRVEKPWGRHSLWPGFSNPRADQPAIGEIWFDTSEGQDAVLLVKYLFTSERLSIQVHPNDAQARAAGYERGKEEVWVILAADPGATIALGTLAPMSATELRASALDGSIETLVNWKPVTAGDVIYSPAGTVHAIGAGITLIEVQQNVDLTYRLYDYGRPRELHLDAGVAVAVAEPFAAVPVIGEIGEGRMLLANSDKFTLERWDDRARSLTLEPGRPAWLIPVKGGGVIKGERYQAGECWLVSDEAEIRPDNGADLLVACGIAIKSFLL